MIDRNLLEGRSNEMMVLIQPVISRVVMPDLIRHPAFSLGVACASEDTGACALACPSGYQGIRAPESIRRKDGDLVV